MLDTLAKLDRGELVGATRLNLTNCSLTTLPSALAQLAPTLEILELSFNPLSSLPSPESFPYAAFTCLKVVFFSNCRFTVFPRELALLPIVTMLAFRHNGMEEIPEGALPSTLRWCILTNNRLAKLPDDIGRCTRLEKTMLAGNELTGLPTSLQDCKRLALLRLSCNKLEALPGWLFEMPSLAFLAFAGNPCTTSSFSPPSASTTRDIPESSITMGVKLGEGASGVIYKAVWASTSSAPSKDVAVKIFKSSSITSDGSPADEMAASLLAGQHANLVSVLGRLASSSSLGLVMELVPPSYTTLGLPPTFDSCTRDVYDYPNGLGAKEVMEILMGLAQAALHIHQHGVVHGDLYAHNILFSPTNEDTQDGHALLGDFGAATVYGLTHPHRHQLERLDMLAFGHLVEDMMGLLTEEDGGTLRRQLQGLWSECVKPEVGTRPGFAEVLQKLSML